MGDPDLSEQDRIPTVFNSRANVDPAERVRSGREIAAFPVFVRPFLGDKRRAA